VLGWLTSAEEAGLDEDGIVALFSSVLRDFFKGRESAKDRERTKDRAVSGTEGVA
jgi:hypothetical protein